MKQFIKKQGRRIGFNYIRMILAFMIGISIIKLLIDFDEKLYTTYALVTIGLGIGVMIREIARAAIVPFLRQDNNHSSLSIRYGQSISIAYISIFFYVIASFILIQFESFFQIDEQIKDHFKIFFFLRVMGYAILMLSIPMMNIYAYKNRMGYYNFWLLLERTADLFAVLAIFLIPSDRDLGVALITNGIAYTSWSVAQITILLWLFHKKNFPEFHFTPKAIDHNTLRFLKAQLLGTSLLVINMALYFRLSLLAVNIILGEQISFIYALSIQLSSYLRQAVMGLMTGVDSFFAKYNLKNSEEAFSEILHLSRFNAVILLILGFIIIINFNYLLDFLLTKTVLQETRTGIYLLSIFFVFGILFLSLSEPWMQYLNGQGKVMSYASKIIIVALSTPIMLISLPFFDNPILIIGAHFVIATGISQLLIVPLVLSSLINKTYIEIIGESLLILSLFIPLIFILK